MSAAGKSVWIGLCFNTGLHGALAATPLSQSTDGQEIQWYAQGGLAIDTKTNSAPDEGGAGLELTQQKSEEALGRLQLGVLKRLRPLQNLDLQGRLEYLGHANVQGKAWEAFSRESSYDNFPLAPHRAWHTFRVRLLTEYNFSATWRLGIDASHDQSIRGSSVFREDSDLETSPLKTGLGYSVMPFVDGFITPDDRVRVYSVFYKNLDHISDVNTYQSYGAGNPSFGVKYHRRFEAQALAAEAHAFRYDFTFNDPSRDFVRTGSSLTLDWQPFTAGLSFGLYGAFWADDFRLPSPRIGDCQAAVIEDSSDAPVKLCSRLDQRYSLGASTHYNWSERSSLAFRYVAARNRNSDLQGADFDQNSFVLMYTFATEGFNHRLLDERNMELEGLVLKDGR